MNRSPALQPQPPVTAESLTDRAAAGVLHAVAIVLAAGTLAYHLVLWRDWPASWIGFVWPLLTAGMLGVYGWLRRSERRGVVCGGFAGADTRAATAMAVPQSRLAAAQTCALPRTAIEPTRRGSASPWASAGALIAVGILAAALTLVVNRPDSDGEYLRRALVQLDHWDEPVITCNVTYDVPVPDIMSTQYLMAYEMLVAQAARWLRLDPINLYFNGVAAAAAALCPLVYYLLGRAFGLHKRAALWAAIGAVFFLMLDGNRHTSPGNWAFVRLWQGKSLVITLGVPWAMWLAVDFLQRPNAAGWFRLFCLNTAAAGLSTTGLFLMPAAGFLVGAAFVAVGSVATGGLLLMAAKRASPSFQPTRGNRRAPAGRPGPLLVRHSISAKALGRRVLLATLAGAAAAWPLAVSLWIYLTGFGADGARASMEIMFASMLQSEPAWLNCLKQIGSGRSFLFYGVLLLAAPWLVLPRRKAMMLCAVSLVGVAAFFNPLCGPLFCRILGPVYFRLFYALPVAFCAGLSCAAAARQVRPQWLPAKVAVLGGALLLLALAASGRAAHWHFPAERVWLAGAGLLLVGLAALGHTRLAAGRRRAFSAAALAGLAALFVLQSESFTFMLRNNAFRKPPLAPRYLPWLSEFLAQGAPHLEDRTVLAPCDMALAAAVAWPRTRFVITFDPYTRWSFAMAGAEQQLAPRLAAQQFAAGAADSPEAFRAFEELTAGAVDAVVAGPAADLRQIARALSAAGDWRLVNEAGGYRLFLRYELSATGRGPADAMGVPVSEYLRRMASAQPAAGFR